MTFEEIYEDLKKQRDEFKENSARLLDILAAIHRDGGHHTGLVGIKQSVEDALAEYYRLRGLEDETGKKHVKCTSCNDCPFMSFESDSGKHMCTGPSDETNRCLSGDDPPAMDEIPYFCPLLHGGSVTITMEPPKNLRWKSPND